MFLAVILNKVVIPKAKYKIKIMKKYKGHTIIREGIIEVSKFIYLYFQV
ncbi:hypothetical protein protein [Bacillus cereus G9241]|nr:hypothetical protein protein [Bacillus cereus G9241]